MRFVGNRTKVAAVVLTGALVAGGSLALAGVHDRTAKATSPREAGAVTEPGPQARTERRVPPGRRLAVDAAVALLRTMQPVAARTSRRYPPIGDVARQQPDLYAAAFTKQLLTQDYRSSRDDLLAWVQSESVPSREPSVVGLTPPGLRDRLAVASLADSTDGPAPIPSPQTWEALGRRHGYTAVRIHRVITPPTWTSAVAAGRVSDPGVTAREVDADVTLHTTEDGRAGSQEYSVALTMNLEGPPTRDDYGFVTGVTYRAVEAD